MSGKRMKILLAAPMVPRPQAPGAIPLLLHAQLVGLAARHEVTLVTVSEPEPAEDAALERLHALGMTVQAVRRPIPAGFGQWRRRWRLASTWLRGWYPWRTIWFWEPAVQTVLNRVLQERFDAVLVEDNAMGIYRYPTRAPIIFTEYEVRRPRAVHWRGCSRANWHTWALSEADWQRWQRYQRATWQRFDRIQVFTTRDAAVLARIAPQIAGRVRINPFSIELSPAADPACVAMRTIIFVGNFSHPPNVDAALWLANEIMPRLRTYCPGIRLTITGIYPPPSVVALAGEDIEVTGYVPAIEPLLERAAVVLAPIRIGGGMRMKVLQSLALGKAVVTTPRGADGLLFEGQQPPLVIAEDAEAIARATATLLTSAEQRQELGRRARDFVANYHSPQAYVGRLEAVYAELVASRLA